MSRRLVLGVVLALALPPMARAEPAFVDSFPIFLVDPGAGFDCSADCQMGIRRAIAHARWLLREPQGDGDVSACLLLEPSPETVGIQRFDDHELDRIDSEEKLQRLLGLGPGVYLVNDLAYCGGPDPSVIGCAETGGNSVVVERGGGVEQLGLTLAHERGHNAGLEHREGEVCGLMRSVAELPYDQGCLDASESERFEKLGRQSGQCPASLGASHFPERALRSPVQASSGGAWILLATRSDLGEPLVWIRGRGATPMPPPYPGDTVRVETISADGSLVGGAAWDDDSGYPVIWRWGQQELWNLASDGIYSLDTFGRTGNIFDFSPDSSLGVGVVPELTNPSIPGYSVHRAYTTVGIYPPGAGGGGDYLPSVSTSGPLAPDERSSIDPVAILDDGRIFGKISYFVRSNPSRNANRNDEIFVWAPGDALLTGLPDARRYGELRAVSDDGRFLILTAPGGVWRRYEIATQNVVSGSCDLGSATGDAGLIVQACGPGQGGEPFGGFQVWRDGAGTVPLKQFLGQAEASRHWFDLWGAFSVLVDPSGRILFGDTSLGSYSEIAGGMFVLPLEGGPGGGGGGGSGTATLSITRFRTPVGEGGGWPVELAWGEGRWSLSGNFPGPEELNIGGTYVEVGRQGRKLRLALDTGSVQVLTDYMETDIAENLNESVELGPGREPKITLKLKSNGRVKLVFSWRLDVSPSNALRGRVRWKLKGKGALN